MIASRFTVTVDVSASADAAYYFLQLVLHYTLGTRTNPRDILTSTPVTTAVPLVFSTMSFVTDWPVMMFRLVRFWIGL